MSVFAPATSFLWKTIESYGLDPEPLFAAEGFSSRTPMDPRARLSYGAVDRIRARAIETLGVETFGLRVAEHLHPSQFGALGYAWLASSTLRSALERMSRYIALFNHVAELELEDTGRHLLVTERINAPSENEAARDDTALAILVQMCRFNCGRSFRPARAWIRHAPPEDTRPWLDFFGCDVRFGAGENRFSVPLDVADARLPTANDQLALINDQLIARDVARLNRGDIVEKVRAHLTEKLSSGCFSEQCIADELKMTVRSLHRNLSRNGTNFSEVLTRTRKELAARYLRDPGLSLTEIAFLLGFSQASSFSRAYRKWTGEPPSETRRKMYA